MPLKTPARPRCALPPTVCPDPNQPVSPSLLTTPAPAENRTIPVFQRILVAIDASSNRHQALGLAKDIASLTGGRVQILHVLASTVAFDTLVRLEDSPEAHAVLDEAVATFRNAGIEADGELVPGLTEEVPDAISTAAEQFNADLIVLSPHHRSSLVAFFDRRVSDAVAHTSRIAVLLAPEAPTGERN